MKNVPLRRRPFLWVICIAFALVWAWSAAYPASREDWWMENVLVLVVLAFAVAGYRHVRLSDLSYFLIFAFLCLHEVGAHYTYEKVPIGYWLKDTFHFRRNDYDRLVHFCFGFCWAFPTRELFIQAAKTRKFWTYVMPPVILLAFSAGYEIIEAYTAQANPGMEEQFVGLQGDLFDSQRDMTCALTGSVFCMVIAAIAQYEGTLPDHPKPVRLPELDEYEHGRRG